MNPQLDPGPILQTAFAFWSSKVRFGAEEVEDDGEPFDANLRRLTAAPRQQQEQAAKLDAAIAANLKELGF
jgi:hypothetical protein